MPILCDQDNPAHMLSLDMHSHGALLSSFDGEKISPSLRFDNAGSGGTSYYKGTKTLYDALAKLEKAFKESEYFSLKKLAERFPKSGYAEELKSITPPPVVRRTGQKKAPAGANLYFPDEAAIAEQTYGVFHIFEDTGNWKIEIINLDNGEHPKPITITLDGHAAGVYQALCDFNKTAQHFLPTSKEIMTHFARSADTSRMDGDGNYHTRYQQIIEEIDKVLQKRADRPL